MAVNVDAAPGEWVAPAEWDRLPLLIDGAFEAGEGCEYDVFDPATEKRIATVLPASAEQLDRAVGAARRAFDEGEWPRMPPKERRAALLRFADELDACAAELADALIAEVGTPMAIARGLQVDWPLQHLRWYADQAIVDRTEDLGPHAFPVPSRSIVEYQPVGAVAAISAYNYPITLAMHKVGPALAMGCTVVLTPSPRTPIATLLFARAAQRAQLPAGVLNVVVADTDRARELTQHPSIDKVAFTGSPRVGTEVMRQAATQLSGVVLELGGKSAAIFLPDADIDEVTRATHLRHLRNGGQACAAPTRILVPREHWERFLEVSRQAYAEIPVGSPREADTVIGPMIDEGHRARIEAMVQQAIDQGAKIAAGGGRPDYAAGWYMNPVLLVDVDNSWPIAQEELFGPVSVAMPYDTVDEAIAIANDSRFGLHAYLFTPDLNRAREIAPRLRAGSVTINGGGGFRPDAPMGGFGISGVGRELGWWGIHEYLEPQHVQWRDE
jgi:aldehyde dehydrogenase (NAD+)